ncbi:MAG: protoheme IX farnesyltransferase [Myxococcales bacterium]|nr:protoheme IX farnesyltransferase [Myxococcales bacterium]
MIATSDSVTRHAESAAPAVRRHKARPVPLTDASERRLGTARDYVALSKPNILLMSVLMAGLGILLAPDSLGLARSLMVLVGTGLIVSSANALNMVLERDVDGLMARTKGRPLPTGRMGLWPALTFGVFLGIGGTVVLFLWGNPLTAGLGYTALVSYVALYTPAKRYTPQALLIGAIPGAMPPLMGWTAVTGSMDAPGLTLFLILLLWQLPHFIAIALYRQSEYARAGFKTVPNVRGVTIAKVQTVAYAVLLVPLCLLLTPIGAATWIYGAVSLLTSVGFLAVCLRGVTTELPARWARRVFLASLVFLPALGVGLGLDRWIG